jgi:hypothetical protein
MAKTIKPPNLSKVRAAMAQAKPRPKNFLGRALATAKPTPKTKGK